MADFDLQPKLMIGEGWADFALLDSGHGRKLERYGDYRFIRPEPQAMWSPRQQDWSAHGEFVPGSDEDGGGRWHFDKAVPREGWDLTRGDVRFTASCTPFRHLGFFPDMAPVWDWMGGQLAGKDDASTLNLFGYTGVGTLSLSEHGPVTHVDASKKSVAQARANAALSGMEQRPVRWIVDDAAKFTAREVRRGKRYDGIILDPPKFGRGPEGEVWRLEESLPGLIGDCAQLLDADSRFLFLTVYAVRMSSLAIAGLLAEAVAHLPGTVEHGDLAIHEEQADGRVLPTAIFARWRAA
ncbi:class I SAM-dependent methyltransferase [Novosphingobium sp. KCTC 2891]|uniref:class I SAM-dependent methyltransferase n=1 Tax=Novosphingobium sp. KCTC 2891 TaxID=2989730 RepID=UPI0022220007|nr:class I SAM-dependent methyltransferase [Novosphingobium sp. KCTC 2891]MCW1382576.1 class I SAM-dependent methyltransferase [Novosphingobium sp. KCTC 2891]